MFTTFGQDITDTKPALGCWIGGAENAGVENAGAITRGNPSEEIP